MTHLFKQKKKNPNKLVGVCLVLFGLFNLVSVPYTQTTEKMVFYAIVGVVLIGSGVWMFKKK